LLSGVGVRVPGVGVRVPGVGVRVLGGRGWVGVGPGVGVRVLGIRVRVSGYGCLGLGGCLGTGVGVLGVGVSGLVREHGCCVSVCPGVGVLTALMRESSTLTAKAVPQAKGCVRYSSVSGSSSSSWSRN